MLKNKREDCYYWPLWFSFLLNPLERKRITKILPKISAAQIFLWRALNIYDDLLDGDIQANKILLKANNYYRRFLAVHYNLGLNKDYYNLLDKLFKKLENANQQEIDQRQKKLSEQIQGQNLAKLSTGYLANKSLILALGPLALLFYLGYSRQDQLVKTSLNFWHYFLSAKQLSDDSRDFKDDLKNNIATLANAPIINHLHKNKTPKIDNDIYLDLLFIQTASPMIIKNLKFLCQKARLAIKKINQEKSSLILDKLIKPIEDASLKSEKFLKLSGLTILHK